MRNAEPPERVRTWTRVFWAVGMVLEGPESLKKRCGFEGKGWWVGGREEFTAFMHVVSRSSMQRGSIPEAIRFDTALAAV
jgi:hypothetical protein